MRKKQQIRDKLHEIGDSFSGPQNPTNPEVQRKAGIMTGLLWVLEEPVTLE